jgi:hypothetical protein
MSQKSSFPQAAKSVSHVMMSDILEVEDVHLGPRLTSFRTF